MAYVWRDSSPVPKDPSPKSHTNDRSSPSGSVAVAVNVTGLPKTGAAGLHVVCSTLGDRFGLRTRSAATATISRTARTTAAIFPPWPSRHFRLDVRPLRRNRSFVRFRWALDDFPLRAGAPEDGKGR